MISLLLAAASFAGLHLVVSGTPLRGVLVKRLGEGPFRGLFSLATFATLYWVGSSYSHAFALENRFLWALPHAQHVAGLVILPALLLAVPGLLERSPTAVGGEGALARGIEPRGMQRITRHPFLWGVMIWAAFHLAANGDLASIILFSVLLLVAAVGTRSIDAKRARALGERWSTYAARTSNLPFAAIAQGRTRLVLSEVGVWRFAVAVAVFAALAWLHPRLFHAAALPGAY